VTAALRATAAVVFVVLATLLALATPAAAQTTEPPNIVLVATDDQRWDTLWAMPTVTDELVEKGVTFTNAFAVNPLCCPARASILTGTYSHTNGVWSNSAPDGGMAAFDDRSTIATWLDAAGYETMLVGKYLNGYGPPNFPHTYVPPGWDRWLAFYGGHEYFDYSLTDGENLREYGPDHVPADYSTDVLAREAAAFVRSAPSPFFLYFTPFAPHRSTSYSLEPAPRHVDAFAGMPYTPPPSLNEADVSDKPRHIRRRAARPVEGLTEVREEQLESLLAVDDAVGQLLEELEEAGVLGNTLVIFTSDNGHTWGEHRLVGKRAPYEESIRVPLVARWDALSITARSEDRLALNIDLAPTIANAADATASGQDGHSFLPLLRGGPAPWRSRFLIEYDDRPHLPAYCGFRSLRWKYVQHGTQAEELYHLAVDPYELDNLAGDPRYRVKVIRGRDRVRESACRPPSGYDPLPLCSRAGTERADRIRGTRWRDWICAGRGEDKIRVVSGDKDVVRCGFGRDTVRADRIDRVHGCERVVRRSKL
jgi:arylsulfatase A-like enzyme